VQRSRLLFGANRHLSDQGVDLTHSVDDAKERVAGLCDELHALADFAGRSRDQAFDLLSGLCRTLGKRAHFRGYDCESPTGFSCARRFDACIQREQIGLERDLVDCANDLTDLMRRLLDAFHCVDRMSHDFATVFCIRARLADHRARAAGAVGGLPNGFSDVGERR
jgi:hypothetical protein